MGFEGVDQMCNDDLECLADAKESFEMIEAHCEEQEEAPVDQCWTHAFDMLGQIAEECGDDEDCWASYAPDQGLKTTLATIALAKAPETTSTTSWGYYAIGGAAIAGGLYLLTQ